MKGVFSVLAMLALGGSAALAGDMTISSTTTNGDRAVSERLSVSDSRLAITQGDVGCVVEMATGSIRMFDMARREHFETSLQELAAYGNRLLPKNKLARKIMRRMFMDVAIKKMKERRTIAGYECELYEEEAAGVTYRIWATKALIPPSSFCETMEKIYASACPLGDPLSPIYAAMRKARAMPLSITLSGTRVSLVGTLSAALTNIEQAMGLPAPFSSPPAEEMLRSSEAVEVSLDPIPDERFQIPPDLKQVDSPFAKKRASSES